MRDDAGSWQPHVDTPSRCSAAPLFDGDRAAGALVLVTEAGEHDDDPAAILDAQLARYRLRMSRLQELSLRVATIANHQIRTPLSVIQGHLELLEDEVDDLPEGARRALLAIRRGVTSLTDALTALMRANDLANAADPAWEAVDLVDGARHASMLVRASHPMLRVLLTVGTRPYVPRNVDPLLVRGAIVALTDALIGPEVDTDVALEVLDCGDMLGVRLTRFGRCANTLADLSANWIGRGDSTTSPRSVGLAVAEAIALSHDGRLEIAATPAA